MKELKKLPEFNYVIFDMDGTLIDSNRYLTAIAGKYLEDRGKAATKEFFESLKADGKEEFCLKLQRYAGVRETLEETINVLDSYTHEVYEDRAKAMPFVTEILEDLKAKNIAMCVASATDIDEVEFVLKRLDLYKYFEFAISVSQVGKGKEEPDIFIEARKRLEAKENAEVLVIEDSRVAMKTAKQAGFKVLAILEDTNLTSEDLSDEHCHYYINSFGELL